MSLLCPVDATGRDGSRIQLVLAEECIGKAKIDHIARLMASIRSDCMCYFGGSTTTGKLGRSKFTGD